MQLSIIVPIYKVEKYINRCVKSLLQKIDAYEIILVDDGSPDKCPQMCDEYGKKCPNITVIHQTNGGLSAARNSGIKSAKGEYICFVDSDDYITDDGLSLIQKTIAVAENADIITFSTMYKCNNSYSKHSFIDPNKSCNGKEYMSFQYSKRSMQIPAWQNIYRREFLVKNELLFKEGIYHEDVQWTPRVFYNAEKIFHCNDYFYIYDIRDDSISTKKDLSKNITDFKSTVIELSDWFQKNETSILTSYVIDSLVSDYLYLFALGNFGNKNIKYRLNIKDYRKYFVFKNTKIKGFLYQSSPKLYCLFMKKFVL